MYDKYKNIKPKAVVSFASKLVTSAEPDVVSMMQMVHVFFKKKISTNKLIFL